MSVEAITWALAQPVKYSTAKFVLVVMANCADRDMLCWPSTAHICQQTSQDRKTVQENLRRLRDLGFIEDTLDRRGSTKQVIVYRLKTPGNGPVKAPSDKAEQNGNNAEIGPVKEPQKRNSSENGIGPNFPHNRSEIPHKEAQISRITGPKTGHGTIKEPSRNHQGTINKNAQRSLVDDDPLSVLLESGVEDQVAKDWIKHRKTKKASASLTVIKSRIKEAGIAGISLGDALALEVSRGWQGFEAAWLQPSKVRGGTQPNRQEALEQRNREIAERLAGEAT